MTESLRLEVRPFGIRVVIIEPGDTKTEITQNRRVAAAATGQQVYRLFATALKRTADDEQQGPGPDAVARLLWRIVNTPSPQLRYTVGPPIQRAAVFMKRLLLKSAQTAITLCSKVLMFSRRREGSVVVQLVHRVLAGSGVNLSA
jgi:short-subunit dehydrogenase